MNDRTTPEERQDVRAAIERAHYDERVHVKLDTEMASALVDDAERRNNAERLLRIAACPNCIGDGVVRCADGTIEQCQWCHERDAYFEGVDTGETR